MEVALEYACSWIGANAIAWQRRTAGIELYYIISLEKGAVWETKKRKKKAIDRYTGKDGELEATRGRQRM